MLPIRASPGQGDDCCPEKTVGGLTYLLDPSWADDPRNTFPCLSSCVYQQEDNPDSWYCFGPGNFEASCEEGIPEGEEGDPFRPLFFNMGEEYYESYEEEEHHFYEDNPECFGHGVLSCREILDLDLLDDVYDDEIISLPGASGNLSRSNTIESGGVHFRNLNHQLEKGL